MGCVRSLDGAIAAQEDEVMKPLSSPLDRIVTLDNMSQAAHLFVAMFVVEHLGRWIGHSVWWLIVVMALAGLKEAVVDPRYESAEVAGNGWKDWASFVVGAVIGFLLSR